MPETGFPKQLFAEFARIGRALSAPARVEMIYLLNQGEKTVEHLARDTGLSHANTSHHLQQLKAARLVTSSKRGQHVVYRLAGEGAEELWQCLQQVGKDRLLEVRELMELYLKNRDLLEPVTREDLVERMARDEVVVLDVRPEDEYLEGHVPSALSMPLDKLEERLRELPLDREIVAYCRGPYCLISYDAVEILRAKGFQALRLEDGFPEWKAENRPLATGWERNG